MCLIQQGSLTEPQQSQVADEAVDKAVCCLPLQEVYSQLLTPTSGGLSGVEFTAMKR